MKLEQQKLYDNHNRIINYLRLAVTDRCNLRCFYCMPEEGIKYVQRKQLLTFEELVRTVTIGASMGISKVRITGGEPFLRKDMMQFLTMISKIQGLDNIHITTNGTLMKKYVPELKNLGIKSINLSLDSLDKERFHMITRRDAFDTVMDCLDELIKYDIPTKINMVVMDDKNIEEIESMIRFSQDTGINVRFIEEMPFNGNPEQRNHSIRWDFIKILNHIESIFGKTIKDSDPAFSTSYNYSFADSKANFGIIAAYSRTFCGTCNRLRLTPEGVLKTCLYDTGVFNIRDLIRSGASDDEIKDTLIEAIGHRDKDGFEAEKKRNGGIPIHESMSTIGG